MQTTIARIFCLLALFAASLAGCSCRSQGPNYNELGLIEVSGQVTMDNKPLAGATVRFEGQAGQFSSGITDANGNFSLRYDSNKTGCLPGEKTVRITIGGGEESEEGAVLEGADGKVIAKAQKIPARYNTETVLNASVSPSNTTFKFELTSM